MTRHSVHSELNADYFLNLQPVFYAESLGLKIIETLQRAQPQGSFHSALINLTSDHRFVLIHPANTR